MIVRVMRVVIVDVDSLFFSIVEYMVFLRDRLGVGFGRGAGSVRSRFQ